ncbi:hypothetical protein [Granulicella sp. dw_53]|uniref:hypothetical protein n=1 Tax=Granulicella sp. dw_53 TaxID=2719792 RepID=UPI001BD4FEBF|nr:hypothetical protein [Granulicella sp. dw_53]
MRLSIAKLHLCLMMGGTLHAQSISPNQIQGTAVVQTPVSSSQGAMQLNGVWNEELFSGGTVVARVNAAIAACGSNPCYIVIPSYAPTGVGWTSPGSNVSIEDQRFYNGAGGFNNGVPDFHYFHQYIVNAAALQSWETLSGTTNSGPWALDLESLATDGGTAHDGIHGNTGGLTISSHRTGGNRALWGENINIQYDNFNNVADGLEIDLGNNNSTDDPGDGTAGIALNLVGGSNTGKYSGVGILIGNVGSQGPNTGFVTAIGVNAYRDYGLNLQSRTSKTADILIGLPDADPAKVAIAVTSSSVSNAQFAVFDNGDLRAAKGQFNTSLTALTLQIGGGATISTSDSIVQAGFLTTGQIACVKSTSPRTIGNCTGAVSGTGSCTCN